MTLLEKINDTKKYVDFFLKSKNIIENFYLFFEA